MDENDLEHATDNHRQIHVDIKKEMAMNGEDFQQRVVCGSFSKNNGSARAEVTTVCYRGGISSMMARPGAVYPPEPGCFNGLNGEITTAKTPDWRALYF